MKYLLPIIILLASSLVFAQDASVISTTANLRGIPLATGKKVTAMPSETNLIVIGKDEDWYLVQSPEYVGWVLGKLIELNDTEEIPQLIFFQRAKVQTKNVVLRGTASDSGLQTSVLPNGTELDVYATVGDWSLVQTVAYAGWLRKDSIRDITPQATTAPISTTGNTIFKTESAVAERNPIIKISNNANKTLILTFGGIKYVIKPNRGRYIEMPEGRYQYTAAGGGATPFTRVEYFKKGNVYAVAFRIITR